MRGLDVASRFSDCVLLAQLKVRGIGGWPRDDSPPNGTNLNVERIHEIIPNNGYVGARNSVAPLVAL